jgi:hypothetical protein
LRASDRRRSLKWRGNFHLDYESPEIFEKTKYSLSLAEVSVIVRSGKRSFNGIYLHETGESQNMGMQTYTRIGDCGIMNGGGDGFVLDGPSWEVSDDNSSRSLPTRLVSLAALLIYYSPSPHPLLRLPSHVPALFFDD